MRVRVVPVGFERSADAGAAVSGDGKAFRAALLIVGVLCAAAAPVFMYMAFDVLGSTPTGEKVGDQRTTGMFGACGLAVMCAFGAFFCGYRYNHGDWP